MRMTLIEAVLFVAVLGTVTALSPPRSACQLVALRGGFEGPPDGGGDGGDDGGRGGGGGSGDGGGGGRGAPPMTAADAAAVAAAAADDAGARFNFPVLRVVATAFALLALLGGGLIRNAYEADAGTGAADSSPHNRRHQKYFDDARDGVAAILRNPFQKED